MTPMALGRRGAIAVAGLVDPAFTLAGRGRARVAILVQDGPTMELLAAAHRSRRAVAGILRARLDANLRSDCDIQHQLTSDAVAAIVIGDRYPGPLMIAAGEGGESVVPDHFAADGA